VNIDPLAFIYSPPFPVLPTLQPHTFWEQWKMKGDFLLYSAFQTVNSSFYKLQAQSLCVSILTYFQALSTLGLVGLFIASYVEQKVK
jgi:hypothetical protein